MRAPESDWMWELGTHWSRMRAAYPDDLLGVVFDIDGTLVDLRHLVVHTLLAYDKEHGTELFHGLRADDIVEHETHIERVLTRAGLPGAVRDDVAAYYRAHLWDPESFLAAHRPYRGVMSVIRWFQLQPRAVVALNTGRPAALRELTLASLNAIGREHRVSFDPSMVFMDEGTEGSDVSAVKVAGIRRLSSNGIRPIAVVDNEPSNIEAMAEADESGEILFLHADTIFESRRRVTPRTVRGDQYGLAQLVSEHELAQRVRFIWHGVNDEPNLRQFLASDVRWAEVDVRLDPVERLVLRHDSYEETPWHRGERALFLPECIAALRAQGRSLKLDLKQDGGVLDRVLAVVADSGFGDEELWWNGSIEVLGERGLCAIASAHPGSTISVPVDFTRPLVAAAPEIADQVLDRLAGWGVDRLSLAWTTPQVRELVTFLEERGWPVNIYGVPDLEAFLEAALLLPASVTADFNFPAWHHFGRGSGQHDQHHRYGALTDPLTPTR